MLAGEDAGPARAAQRIHDEAISEGYSTIGQAPLQGRHRKGHVPTLIVGYDQHQTRALRRRGARGPGRAEQRPDQGEAKRAGECGATDGGATMSHSFMEICGRVIWPPGNALSPLGAWCTHGGASSSKS